MDASEFVISKTLDATGSVNSLTDREKHLIGLAVTLTRGCIVCTGGRIEKAIDAGIDYETIRSTVDLAGAVNAGVTMRTAIRNGLDEVCSGPECVIGLNS